MITLIRHSESPQADTIERRLRGIAAAYKVILKDISLDTYLIDDGSVYQGEGIEGFLDRQQDAWKILHSGSSDMGDMG
ncbi:MAG: hypothetical protein OEY56_01180 [Cyclobacteriaceae bacterium]|nr:hypothetical protein [Cyclobacteriaceae bacterium]